MNMIKTLTIQLSSRSYDIRIGSGLLATAGLACKEIGLSGRAAIITNTTVAPLYAPLLVSSLKNADFETYLIKIPDGEEYKTVDTLTTVYDQLLAAGIDRHDFIIALGGGVVGDLAGFAAATWLRGIPFVQMPTTLLAQVDSSVGGKTGVDHSSGKNLIGAFYQPALVLADLDTLQTLSKRHYCAGLAEVVKYGMVLDYNLFEKLETTVPQLLARNTALLAEVVGDCCTLKAKVVEQDEREAGIRAVLNYGHTLGHAFETLGNYRDLVHGEAVAIGMIFAAEIAYQNRFADAAARDRLIALLQALHLPLSPPDCASAELIAALCGDKKNHGGSISYICNRGIGSYEFLKLTPVELDKAFRDALPVIQENLSMELIELSLEDILQEEELSPPSATPKPVDTIKDTSSDPMLTPTFAELYYTQGFKRKALNIYKQLHELHPEDQRIASRYLELSKPSVADTVEPCAFQETSDAEEQAEHQLSPAEQAKIAVLESWLENISNMQSERQELIRE